MGRIRWYQDRIDRLPQWRDWGACYYTFRHWWVYCGNRREELSFSVTYFKEEKGLFPYVRSKELLFRWTELETFGSALLRSHIGSSTELNAQIYDDDCSLSHFAIFSDIFAELADYRLQLMGQSRSHGTPIVRPMFADFSYDDQVWSQNDQFLFGSDFLVAPVLHPSGINLTSVHNRSSPCTDLPQNASCPLLCDEPFFVKVKVYLPSNSEWVHLWSGEHYECYESGNTLHITSPIGNPPVFFKRNSSVGMHLREHVIRKGLNRLFAWENATISP